MSALNATEVIAAWKQPAIRATLASSELTCLPQHPAGRSPFESDPACCAGAMLPGTLRTVGALTSIMSCNIACGETMWDGSCDFFSYGCCA
jgi:mersacidin/lichenicidin family type 2 lantibiotic